MDGRDEHAASKMSVGYFTQYQVEELDPTVDTPVDHDGPDDEGRDAGRRCATQLGRFGFSGDKALTKVGQAVGRRARAPRAGAGHPCRAASADPRRADQPPGRRYPRGAGPSARRI